MLKLNPLQRLAFHWQVVRQIPYNEQMDYIAEKWKRRSRKAAPASEENGSHHLPAGIKKLNEFLNRARSEYIPHPYSGPITLFRAEMWGDERPRDPLLGWGELAKGGIDVHIVPGCHGNQVTDPGSARVLARKLRACYMRALSR